MDLLFDNFEILADAPGGVKKLREMVLQLAVQGKLVPQNPNDEPASILLEKIKKEKERLIKEGKIKKDLLLTKNIIQKSYEVPEGWVLTNVGSVCNIKMGQSPPGSTYNTKGKGMPLINGPVEFTAGPFGKTINRQYTTKPTKVCSKGDFLLCVRGSTTGRTNISDFEACIGRGIAALQSFLYHDYFNWYIVSIRDNLYQSGTGSTFKNISFDKISNTTIPVPPLAEQERIVAKVDKLMALCDNLEKQQQEKANKRLTLNKASLNALNNSTTKQEFNQNWGHITKNFDLLYSTPENVKELKQSILQLAVQGKLAPQDPKDEPASVLLEKIRKEKERLIKEGETKKHAPLPPITVEDTPFDLPSGWVRCHLNDISEVVRGGSPRPAGDPQFYNGKIPFLKVADLTADDYMTLNTYTYTIKEAGLKKTRLVKPNTLMLTNSGATLGIPKICNFETTFNDGIAAFLNIPNNIFKPFLYLFLKSKTLWFLEFASRGQGQPNLNTDIIRETILSLPPTNEQKRIVAKVDKLMAFCDNLSKSLADKEDKNEKLINAVVNQI